jgi:hypothetical protein
MLLRIGYELKEEVAILRVIQGDITLPLRQRLILAFDLEGLAQQLVQLFRVPDKHQGTRRTDEEVLYLATALKCHRMIEQEWRVKDLERH